MAVTLHHVYSISGSSLNDPDRIKAAVQSLVPSPLPTDLRIDVGPGNELLVSYSYEHADADAAAAAAIHTMKGEPF